MKPRKVNKLSVSQKLAAHVALDKKTLTKNSTAVLADEPQKTSIKFLLNPIDPLTMAPAQPAHSTVREKPDVHMEDVSSAIPAAALSSQLTSAPRTHSTLETKHTRYNHKKVCILVKNYLKGEPYIKYDPTDPTHKGMPVKMINQTGFNRRKERAVKKSQTADVSMSGNRTANAAVVHHHDAVPRSLANGSNSAKFFQSNIQGSVKRPTNGRLSLSM